MPSNPEQTKKAPVFVGPMYLSMYPIALGSFWLEVGCACVPSYQHTYPPQVQVIGG